MSGLQEGKEEIQETQLRRGDGEGKVNDARGVVEEESGTETNRVQ